MKRAYSEHDQGLKLTFWFEYLVKTYSKYGQVFQLGSWHELALFMITLIKDCIHDWDKGLFI